MELKNMSMRFQHLQNNKMTWIDGIVKSTNHVILNEVRVKNLIRLMRKFQPDSSLRSE